MAKVDVAVSSQLSADQAWKLASDLHRFDEWLTIFGGWRSPVPDTVELGTTVSASIKVKGFRNTIHWEVTQYDAPKRIRLDGSGFGGVKIVLTMSVVDTGAGTDFRVLAELKGGLLSGPVGAVVARVIRSDVEQSVNNLASLGR